MNIGLSLPLDFFNSTRSTASSQWLYDALGESRNALPELKRYEVSAIELGHIRPNATASHVLDAARSILDSGMHLTLHGSLATNETVQPIEVIYPQLFPTLVYLKENQQKTLMVVHAHAFRQTSCSRLMDTTVQSITHLIEELNAHAFPLSIGLEINRYHGIADPGTTYDGLLTIAERVNSSAMGFCWDMGHTQSSVIQNRLPATPPRAFLKDVIHTHIHGLAPDGDTHRPLLDSHQHISEGIHQLKPYGYKGLYNLELYPERWGVKNTVRDGILGSIACLREMLC